MELRKVLKMLPTNCEIKITDTLGNVLKEMLANEPTGILETEQVQYVLPSDDQTIIILFNGIGLKEINNE